VFLLALVAWSLYSKPGAEGEALAAPTVGPDEHLGLSRQALAQGMIQYPGPHPRFIHGVIQSGDTASALFSQWMTPAELAEIAEACKGVYSLRRLRPGQPYCMTVQGDRLSEFDYETDSEQRLVVQLDGEGAAARLEPIAYDIKPVVVQGRIDTSLIEAMLDAGEDVALALDLADIFAWDVDFCRDLRPGDSFTCLASKRYRNGILMGYGPILSARFINQGESFEAFRYPDEKGNLSYFDAEGKSLRKVFLKAPLSFRRISSGFSYHRLHPILKIYRPHTGIDYAASTGTPVWSVGDGVVVKRGRSKSAGNYVRVRHNSVYTTQYCHFSRFAGLKRGDRVRQGQVIGYVGMTGYATGPHLDFRMYYRGKPINPRTVKSPSCKPVPAGRMNDFDSKVKMLRAALDGNDTQMRLAEAMYERQQQANP
jgi:murein DD-endopeptidase MepM/ murein hydrolase activator NlpD